MFEHFTKYSMIKFHGKIVYYWFDIINVLSEYLLFFRAIFRILYLLIFILKYHIYFISWYFVRDYDLKAFTRRTICFLHIGHLESNFAQVKHVDIWPHSKIKQSMGLDIQMLHSSESGTFDSSGRSVISDLFCVARLVDDNSLVLLWEEDGTWLLISCEKLFCNAIAGADACAYPVSK